MFLAPSVCVFFFVYFGNLCILGTAERICTKFTWKTCLVPPLDEFEGQRSRSQGQKTAFFCPLAACVQFVFGRTPVASSILNFLMKILMSCLL